MLSTIKVRNNPETRGGKEIEHDKKYMRSYK